MLEIRTISDSIVTGGKLRLDAVGGVAPYSFSLTGDGDGGSIVNSSFYLAPFASNNGFQEIQVTDSNNATAKKTIYLSDYAQVVCNIIKEFMGLEDDQVYVYNEKFIIPKDNRLYVSVGYSGIKTIGNNSNFNDGIESQYITSQAQLNINIMSKNFVILSRKEEVLLALKSSVSQRYQYLNNFRIASVPTTTNDVSGVDGALISYRFNSTINIIYTKFLSRNIDYFDDFEKSIITEE